MISHTMYGITIYQRSIGTYIVVDKEGASREGFQLDICVMPTHSVGGVVDFNVTRSWVIGIKAAH